MKLSLTDSSITISGVVSYCACKCKHCLLCSGDELLNYVQFEKLKQLALKFSGFRAQTGIDVGLSVYHCSDYPQLPAAMDIDRQISKYSGYQNLNGTPIRNGKDLSKWVSYLKNDCGVINPNLSWFGTECFHDNFVQRKGYFKYLIDLAVELQKQNVAYSNSIFILKSNLDLLEKLHTILEPLGGTINYSLLDYRGNAKNIFDEFLKAEDVSRMPNFLFNGGIYNFNRNKMNSEWVKRVLNHSAPKLTKRAMLLVAKPQNIDEYLSMSCLEIVELMHQIDNKLQDAIPSIEFLAQNYGVKCNDVLFDYRSALWKWIDMFFNENNLDKSILFSDLHTSVMWR